jgi:hypothetical protein
MQTSTDYTGDVMLRAMDALDLIQENTGINTKHRARIWAAVENPREAWLAAHRIKITPKRALGAVVAELTNQSPTRVPAPQDILDALTAVTTPKEAPAVDQPTHDPDL